MFGGREIQEQRQHITLELVCVFLLAHRSLLTLSLTDISCVRQTGVRSPGSRR